MTSVALLLTLSSFVGAAVPPAKHRTVVPAPTLQGVIKKVISGTKGTSILIQNRKGITWVEVKRGTRLILADRRPARRSDLSAGKHVRVITRGKPADAKHRVEAQLIIFEAQTPPS
jgi:hypothetical protein